MLRRIFTFCVVFLSMLSGNAFCQADPVAKYTFNHKPSNRNMFISDAKKGGQCRLGDNASWVEDGKDAAGIMLHARKSLANKPTILYVPNSLFDSKAFTITLDIKPVRKSPGMIGDQYFLCGQNVFFRFSTDRHAFEFGVRNDNGKWACVSTNKRDFIPTNGQWYKLQGVYDGSEIFFYIDGKLIGKSPLKGGVRHGSYTLGSMAWPAKNIRDFTGMIDEVTFYNIPLGCVQKTVQANVSPLPQDDSRRVDVGKGLESRPFALIPRTSEAPVINGKVSGDVWDKAVWLGNPVYINENSITQKVDYDAGVLWDDEALYVGVKIRQNRKPAVVMDSQGDDGLERDDSAEVMLFIPGFAEAHGQVVQFKLNCKGQRDDAVHFDFKWNPKWQGAVNVDGNNWSATFKIPFTSLGGKPKIGTQWGANIAIFQVGMIYRGFLWGPVWLRHHHAGQFGVFEFGDNNIPSSQIGGFRQNLSSLMVSGRLASRGVVRVLLFDRNAKHTKDKMMGNVIVDFDEDGNSAIAQKALTLKSAGEWNVCVENIPAGDYLAKVIVRDAAGRVVNVDVKPIQIKRSVEMLVRRYPVAGSTSVKVNVTDLGKAGVKPGNLKLVLSDDAGKVIREMVQPLGESLPTQKTFMLDKLENGRKYLVKCTALSDDGGQSVTDESSFTLPSKPVWWNTDAGALHGKVLKPWTPIEVTSNSMSCWGRTVEFGKNVFPAQIISRKRELLESPMRLIIQAKGQSQQTMTASSSPVKIHRSDTGDKSTFEVDAQNDDCTVDVKGYMEFDGFMRFHVDVTPRKPLEKLSVVLPLSKELAKFIMPVPNAANRDNLGRIGKNVISMKPENTLWICNEYVGLFFACDSTQQWQNRDESAIEVRPESGSVNLCLNFLKDQNGSTAKRHYSFYLQATPIRPRNKDWYANGARRASGLQWGMNVTPLEDDVVKRLDVTQYLSQAAGGITLELRNTSDLAAITEMDLDNPAADQKIMSINSKAGTLTLMFSKHDNGMVLKTPWGAIARKNNAAWQLGQTHRVEISWSDGLLKFYIDGTPQGELKVRSIASGKTVMNLGSVSAFYELLGLTITNAEKKVAFEDKTPMNLRSSARTVLNRLTDIGATYSTFFEHWCHSQAGGKSKYEPLLKLMAKDTKRLGLGFTVYFGFEIGELPENADMIDECKAIEDRAPNYYSPQKQNTYIVSYGSPYQEYILYNMARLKKEMGLDGVYLDGTFMATGSDNRAFGCGYVDENGKRIPTIPFERIRSMAKRVNNLFAQDGGYVVAHLGVMPPTMGFATHVYLGEHVGFTSRNWQSMTEVVPLDVGAAIYSGENTGVPMVLCYQLMWPNLRKLKDYWYARGAAWSDLHRLKLPILLENPIAPEGKLEMEKIRKLTDFGADNCQWMPYWDPACEKACSQTKGLKMSVFRRKDGAMVCVLYNTASKEQTAVVDLTADKKLSVGQDFICKELISEKPVSFDGKTFRISVPKYEGKMILVQKKSEK